MQPAIAQGIGPLLEPHFSTSSDGFRPGRRARLALAALAEAHREGRRDAADCDLQSVFDTVPQGLVRPRWAKRISDRRGLRRLGRSRRAGVIRPAGRRAPTACGVPQGGPGSPWLATGLLDALDKAWERRGRRVARSADDWLLFVRSQRAAPRVRQRLRRCIEGHWRLRGNPHTSRAARRSACSFLGVELRPAQLPWPAAAAQRVKERVRAMTNRRHGRHRTSRLEALKR
jgi:RNA-directed DNA polymerase